MKLTDRDIQQIKQKSISPEEVESQIMRFKSGIPFTKVVEAATVGNGIMKMDEDQKKSTIEKFKTHKNELKMVKFVPASGAATRMFKFLFQFLNDFHPEKEDLKDFIKRNDFKELKIFSDALEQLPFYEQVLEQLESKGVKFDSLPSNKAVRQFAREMLDTEALNFGNCPKGLLPFHKYSEDHIITAFQEHLYEAALYASQNKNAKLHFTISKQHESKFIDEFKDIRSEVEKETGVKFEVSFSYQQQSTDTIAVTLQNEPFREEDGSILFRPSGHGALLKNLNAIKADLIFIKNIDNVVVSQYRSKVATYKKILAGRLINLQEKTFSYLQKLDKGNISENELTEIEEFLKKELVVKTSDKFKTYAFQDKVKYLHKKLNRPIRVCGMVKNEGEPGGGPFWVKDQDGDQSLQIVESAQINLEDKNQEGILKNATHFNPVDLVCGVTNYKGEKFDLEKYVDANSAFITTKTKAGKKLKALELPGLWNGSMAHWNTIFVEVPVITFNPVKTVNDLLKSTHQVN